jgi:antirestriction protein ArdC
MAKATSNAERCREITEQILAKLESGVVPWRCPWEVGSGRGRKDRPFMPMGLPVNAVTGRPYSGMNMMILWLAKDRLGHPYDLWATEKTWERISGKVAKDERPTSVCYWFMVEIEVVEGGVRKRKKVPFQKWYDVYNLAQVVGAKVPARLNPVPATPQKRGDSKPILDYGPAEELIKRVNPDLHFGGNSAFYHRVGDYVRMPERKKFVTAAGYYSTLLHEIGHWTGAKKRLGRFDVEMNDDEYAFEELVAELGACFLLARLGVPERLDEHPEYQMEQHASYLKSWVSRLKNDEQAIWKAAGLASRWTNYVVDLNVIKESKPKAKKKAKKKPGRKTKARTKLRAA